MNAKLLISKDLYKKYDIKKLYYINDEITFSPKIIIIFNNYKKLMIPVIATIIMDENERKRILENYIVENIIKY